MLQGNIQTETTKTTGLKRVVGILDAPYVTIKIRTDVATSDAITFSGFVNVVAGKNQMANSLQLPILR